MKNILYILLIFVVAFASAFPAKERMRRQVIVVPGSGGLRPGFGGLQPGFGGLGSSIVRPGFGTGIVRPGFVSRPTVILG
ncbi:34 kDa spicule matrix protein-like isoform X2 [Artemia franciscana]|uniref:34 kDa spicule matrix protein-like isoform X2 n=1 Tax=Artemia franciscana TaxID=6661 RepID=UPI0032DB571E